MSLWLQSIIFESSQKGRISLCIPLYLQGVHTDKVLYLSYLILYHGSRYFHWERLIVQSFFLNRTLPSNLILRCGYLHSASEEEIISTALRWSYSRAQTRPDQTSNPYDNSPWIYMKHLGVKAWITIKHFLCTFCHFHHYKRYQYYHMWHK